MKKITAGAAMAGTISGTATVENTPAYELPSAGGPGTYLYSILGSMLLALAVFRPKARRVRRR